jgi:hypothetical protein
MYSAMPTRRLPQTIAHVPMLGLCGMGDASSLLSSSLTGGAISAGVSLATSAASLWMSSIQLSHEADTATTQIVNGLEPLLNANKNAYLAGPGTCADQAAALSAFDTAILWLQSAKACGNGAYGSAGNRCISDRLCESGCSFPWVAWYRDPIANDPRASQCAAQLAASNPNAGQQSAITNLLDAVTGNPIQTTAGQFGSVTAPVSSVSGTGVVGTTGTVTVDPLTGTITADPLGLGTIAGIPATYLLVGFGAVILIAVVAGN